MVTTLMWDAVISAETVVTAERWVGESAKESEGGGKKRCIHTQIWFSKKNMRSMQWNGTTKTVHREFEKYKANIHNVELVLITMKPLVFMLQISHKLPEPAAGRFWRVVVLTQGPRTQRFIRAGQTPLYKKNTSHIQDNVGGVFWGPFWGIIQTGERYSSQTKTTLSKDFLGNVSSSIFQSRIPISLKTKMVHLRVLQAVDHVLKYTKKQTANLWRWANHWQILTIIHKSLTYRGRRCGSDFERERERDPTKRSPFYRGIPHQCIIAPCLRKLATPSWTREKREAFLGSKPRG